MSAFSVDGVLDALHNQPALSPGGGRAIMLIAGQRGQGVTSAACAVAEAASATAAYAIDLDLKRNAMLHAFGEHSARISGVLGGAHLYAAVDAKGRRLAQAPASFFYRRVGRSRLFVGEFDAAALGNHRVWISDRADYWNAARATGGTMVVAAPALDRSQAGLRVARHMDGVVLVVGANPGAAPAAIAAKEALLRAGANLIGLVYAGVTAPVMAIERLLRHSA